MSSDRASVARRNFQRYPRWFDPFAGEWRAFSEHPLYSLARKVRDNRELWPTDVPSVWIGGAGAYNFVRFLEAYLPARPPFHKLDVTVGDPLTDSKLSFGWRFVRPSRKRLYADKGARYAVEMFEGYDAQWTESPNPSGLPRTWERADFDLPEDDTYVRVPSGAGSRLWYLLSEAPCVCTPASYWSECDCPFAAEVRYGEPKIGELFAGSVRVATDEAE